MMTAGREDDRAHYACHQTVREIVQQIVNGLLGRCSASCTPVNQRQIGFIASFIVIAFQHRRGRTAGLTHPQTGGDTFASLEAAAEHRH